MSEYEAARPGLSSWVAPAVWSGLGRANLADGLGWGGHLYTRLEPLAEEVTSNTASNVSAIADFVTLNQIVRKEGLASLPSNGMLRNHWGKFNSLVKRNVLSFEMVLDIISRRQMS